MRASHQRCGCSAGRRSLPPGGGGVAADITMMPSLAGAHQAQLAAGHPLDVLVGLQVVAQGGEAGRSAPAGPPPPGGGAIRPAPI